MNKSGYKTIYYGMRINVNKDVSLEYPSNFKINRCNYKKQNQNSDTKINGKNSQLQIPEDNPTNIENKTNAQNDNC